MKVEINRSKISYYGEDGEYLDGDRRVLDEALPTVIRVDEDDVAAHGSEIEAAAHYIRNYSYGIPETSVPIPDELPEGAWLGDLAEEFDGTVTETTFRVLDCSREERAQVFRRAARRP